MKCTGRKRLAAGEWREANSTTPLAILIQMAKKKVGDAFSLLGRKEASLPEGQLREIRMLVRSAEEKLRKHEAAPEGDVFARVEIFHAKQQAENAIMALSRSPNPGQSASAPKAGPKDLFHLLERKIGSLESKLREAENAGDKAKAEGLKALHEWSSERFWEIANSKSPPEEAAKVMRTVIGVIDKSLERLEKQGI